MRKLQFQRSVECQSDVCSVWNALTDTDRLNRAIGNGAVKVAPLEGAGAARHLLTTRLGGFNIAYEERPYEWVYLQRFQILRRMRSGPVTELGLRYLLSTLPSGGTRVALECEVTVRPGFGLLTPIIRRNTGQILGRLEQELLRLDGQLVQGIRPTLPNAPLAIHAEALERAASALRKTDPSPTAAQLLELLATAPDTEVSRIRPFQLADALGGDRRALLATCLRAVKAGLLELRWDIVCPSCRTVSSSIPSLSALTQHGACQLCEIQFGLDLDQAVEATFSPSPAIRRVDEGPYCIGGPARTPHVMAQSILPAGGKASLVAPTEPGAYRVFVRGGLTAALELQAGAPGELRVDLTTLSDAAHRLAVAPGGTVVVTNPSSDERHAKLEQLVWNSQAATARIVTALPEFRREFSSETLRPGTSLRISRMGLFFSDLADSTQLYATTGDAAAFKLVQDHFDLLTPIIERNGGAVVKTIGDAVMAAFSDELDGVRACREVLSAFDRFRAVAPDRMRTHIKVGFFSGPCFVLTANGVLDYFGQTVNIAARLQAQARSGELVLEASLADTALQAGVITAGEITERYQATLKGVDGQLSATRIQLRTEAARGAA